MKNRIFTNFIKYNSFYQIFIGLLIWIVMISFLIDKNIVVAEEISETHKQLRNMIIEETYRDYYGINYDIDGVSHKRPIIKDAPLSNRFYRMQYELIDDIFNDYYRNNNTLYAGLATYKIPIEEITEAVKASLDPQPHLINPKPGTIDLVYCIKTVDIYYLTNYDIFALKPILIATCDDMHPVLQNIFGDILIYGYYTPVKFRITNDDYTTMINDIETMFELLGNRKYLRQILCDLRLQQTHQTFITGDIIDKEDLVEFFTSVYYKDLINSIKNKILEENIPF